MANMRKYQKESFLVSNLGFILAGISGAIGIYLIVSAILHP